MADQIDSVMYNVKSSKTTNGVDPGDINTLVLPGMQTVTIANGIQRIQRLSNEMRESEDLCLPISTRLRFLQTALPRARASIHPDEYTEIARRYALVVVSAIDFIKHYSSKRGPQRVVASRAVREGVRRIHSEIDAVFIAAGFGSAPEMTDWRDEEEEAIDMQHACLTEVVSNPATLVNGLTNEELHEALAEIQFESMRRQNSRRFKMVLDLARTAVAGHLGIDLANYSIPEWFVSRDDVKVDEHIDIGAFGAVHRAEWGVARTVVCAKLLLVDGTEAQQQLLAEANVWNILRHPNIVRMLGACHVGTPRFFISELARNGNLVDYLQRMPKNKQKIWQLFVDAAQGLSYLHGQGIMHGNLKCSNILVSSDGKAKLIDFGFSHTRTLAIGKSVKVQAMAVRWKAPECVLNSGVYANPRFESDVYSLGMSIIEAMTGHVPWSMVADDDIIDELSSGTGYPRPDGVFDDKEWDLVLGMTAFDVTKRMSLPLAIEALRQLACQEFEHDEAMAEPECVCGMCVNPYAPNSKFCSKCGGRLPSNETMQDLADVEVATEVSTVEVHDDPGVPSESFWRPFGVVNIEVWALVHGMTVLEAARRMWPKQGIDTLRKMGREDARIRDNESVTDEKPLSDAEVQAQAQAQATYLRCVEQVNTWRADEPKQRREWDASVPQFSWCEACYCDNPLDNTFCCECDEVLSMYLSREDCAFRFVVMDVPALEVVLDTFRLKTVLLAKQSATCPACGSLNPRDWSKCSNCDYTEPLTRAALLSEIDRLTIVLEHSKAVADTRKRQHELEDQLPEYPCSRCGEMNPEDEAYCRECGLDIEVIDDLDRIPEEHPIPV